MKTYEINGTLSNAGKNIEIFEEYISGDFVNAEHALSAFLSEDPDRYFDGRLTLCDAETRGQEWAVFKNSYTGQQITVDLI